MRKLLSVAALSIGLFGLGFSSAQAQTFTQQAVPNNVQQVTFGGTATALDVLTVTVHDSGLPGGQVSISTPVPVSRPTARMAQVMVSAINANTALQGIGVSATSQQSIMSIRSRSPNATTYTLSENVGATETMSLSTNHNVVTNAIIGGTAKVGDKLFLDFFDAGLPLPNLGTRTVVYTLVAGDTLNTAAAGLAASINAHAGLAAIGVTATSAGNVISIRSDSPNTTTYGQRLGGPSPTDTITLVTNPNSIQDFVIGGTSFTGSNFQITAQDQALSGGQETISYLAQPTDDTRAVACGLAAAVNNDSQLTGHSITASCGGSFISIVSLSPNPTTFASVVLPKIQSTCTPVAAQPNSPQWPPYGAVLQCGTGTNGALVLSTVQALGSESSDAAAKLTQAVHIDQGDIRGITIFDTRLPGGQVTIQYTTTANDSLPGIAAGITDRINTHPDLQGKIVATASGTVFTVTSIAAVGPAIQPLPNTGTGTEFLVVQPPPTGSSVSVAVGLPLMWYDFADAFQEVASDPFLTGGPIQKPSNTEAIAIGTAGITSVNRITGISSSNIFDTVIGAGVNNVIAHTAAHETGHMLDFIYGGNGANYSEVTAFQEALNLQDLTYMLKIPACSFDATDGKGGLGGFYASTGTTVAMPSLGGLYGFFTLLVDTTAPDPAQPTADHHICSSRNATQQGDGPSLLPPYQTSSPTGSDNLNIFKTAYPAFKYLLDPTKTDNFRAKEMFAEEYAASRFPDNLTDPVTGKPIPGSDTGFQADVYNAFVCTRLYVNSATQYGRAPTANELQSAGYDVPDYPVVVNEPNDPKVMYGPGTTRYSCDKTSSYHTYNFGL